MEELIVRIENVLKHKTGTPDNNVAVKIGSYHFHSHLQLLKNENDDRKLSFRESGLLKLLYNNRDKIIDLRQILNLLWGNNSLFNARNPDVYITKLRSYLKNDSNLQIITIKGIGYRFVINKL